MTKENDNREIAQHIAVAFTLIANANHYMVGFVRVNTTLEQLEIAKQFLIVQGTKYDDKDEVTERALDLIEAEIKGWKI